MTERKLPAYPLFVKDPNFSLWAMHDDLTEGQVMSWWGEEKPLYGFIETEEGTFCFLGLYDAVKDCGVLCAEQTSVNVTAFTTDYTFKAGKATLGISFVSPLLPTDAEMISLPVCYCNYEVTGVKRARVSLFINRRVCFNARSDNADREVHGGVTRHGKYETAFFGLKRQMYLSNNDDAIGADWGYFYAAGENAFIADESSLRSYLATGDTEFTHSGEELYIAATGGRAGRIAVAYNDIVAIDYFGNFLKTMYLEDHTVFDAIDTVMMQGDAIDKRLNDFNNDLYERASAVGEDYYAILTASLRQSIAAHKLVRDRQGNILFLSKENGSNGCIATVDVSYPSMPLYLLYNPELVKGMMRPIVKFADMPVWQYDFAPHDAGTYPACCGQAYGLKCDGAKYHANYVKDGFLQTHPPIYDLPANFDAYDFRYQMPVEECANMLIMTAATERYDKDVTFFTKHKKLFDKWVNYLVKYGLKPENQLCTDDFAGHLSDNLNLAVKATVGIGSYARLCAAADDNVAAEKYNGIARKYADELTSFMLSYDHSPLTWNSKEDTFSLKYNLAFDKLLDLGLFPSQLREKETDCYLQKSNEYGVPLDSRADYTKSDWICWAASLTDDAEKRRKLMAPIAKFLRTSPSRVPFTDWYDTRSGKQCGFQARSVQGGCFILLLNGKSEF